MRHRYSSSHSRWLCGLLLGALPPLSVSSVLGADEFKVSGPDGALEVALELEKGELSYQIEYGDKTMLEPSPLGVETTIGSYSTGLSAEGSKVEEIKQTYELPHGKAGKVDYEANRLTCTFKNQNGGLLDVILQVSNHDVALAYRISHPDQVRAVITGEKTGFKFPTKATTFITPQAPYGDGWMGTKPSYEEMYVYDEKVGAKSQYGLGFTFPGLFRIADDGWVLLSETGVTSDYVGTRLGEPDPSGLYPIAFPEKNENGGFGETGALVSLPAQTSWKTITVGPTLKPIVETTVSYDVVEPLIEPTMKYPSGRSVWSWLIWQDGSIVFDDQKTFIDLAAELKFEYVLVDNWWDQKIGRERIPELVDYAKGKGVKVILWYNSNGAWNQAPQTPQDCMDSAPARRKEMAWMKEAGVSGIKVDFFGGDKQATMKLYEDILVDANEYGLGVNFHGATLPRGWEKMYPNHMTSEAVLGSEAIFFHDLQAQREALTSTTLPFTRNTTAAMDFGPVMMVKHLSKDGKGGNLRRTTDTFQLATAVLYQSGIQHFGVTPLLLEQHPEPVIDFIRKVPANWDETRFVDGYPGKFVVLGRRSGDKWYIAATNAEESEKEITINLGSFQGREIQLYRDKADGSTEVTTEKVPSDGKLKLTLKTGGGAVLVL